MNERGVEVLDEPLSMSARLTPRAAIRSACGVIDDLQVLDDGPDGRGDVGERRHLDPESDLLDRLAVGS